MIQNKWPHLFWYTVRYHLVLEFISHIESSVRPRTADTTPYNLQTMGTKLSEYDDVANVWNFMTSLDKQ